MNLEMNNCTWQPHSDDYYKGHEAGQQSKQAEVDELRKRVDEALKVLSNMKQHGVDEAIYILKGACDE